MFKPFSDEQLQALDDQFGAIHVYTPTPRARPRWAKDADAPPEPAFQLVFRACLGNEWENIMGQANDAKRKASAPRNLAMATIVAVSVDGVQTFHTPGAPASDPAARKAPRDALDALMKRPGNAGIGEAVSDALAQLNGVVADVAEKD